MKMARSRYSPPNGQICKTSSSGTPMKAKASSSQSATRSWRIGKIAMSAV